MALEVEPALLLELVAEVADRLAETTTADQMAELVLTPLADTLGACLATIALRADERTLRLVATVGMPTDVTSPWAEFDIAAAVPLAASVREGRPHWLPDEEEARAQFAALPRHVSASSWCTLPLRSGSRVVGVLGLGWSERHEFPESEQQSLQTVAALLAAALAEQRPAEPDRLHLHEHAPYDDVTLACLSRTNGARCTVQRGNPRRHPGPRSVFATLLDADPELPPATLERASGVLTLCRRRRVPPALVGQAIAEITEDLDGPITGAHIEISDASGWLAVAPLDDAVLISSTAEGAGRFSPPRDGVLAGERVVMAGKEAAVVVVVTLEVGTDRDTAQQVQVAADRVTSDGRHGSAAAVLTALAEELERSETTPCVRGVLAVAMQPRPDQVARSRSLPAQPVSSRLGRRFATAALAPEAGDETAADLAIVTTELVSNAVRHAHDDVDVTVSNEAGTTTVAVTDDDDRRPTSSGDEAGGESGRGLALIRALAEETGIVPRPMGGKLVWARLRWRTED